MEGKVKHARGLSYCPQRSEVANVLIYNIPSRIIDDDRRVHALRIYVDAPTRAVRLQASVHEGYLQW